jgi:hypothetical protein
MLHFRLGAGELLGVQKRGRSVNKSKTHKSNKSHSTPDSVLHTWTSIGKFRIGQLSCCPPILLWCESDTLGRTICQDVLGSFVRVPLNFLCDCDLSI